MSFYNSINFKCQDGTKGCIAFQKNSPLTGDDRKKAEEFVANKGGVVVIENVEDDCIVSYSVFNNGKEVGELSTSWLDEEEDVVVADRVRFFIQDDSYEIEFL